MQNSIISHNFPPGVMGLNIGSKYKLLSVLVLFSLLKKTLVNFPNLYLLPSIVSRTLQKSPGWSSLVYCLDSSKHPVSGCCSQHSRFKLRVSEWLLLLCDDSDITGYGPNHSRQPVSAVQAPALGTELDIQQVLTNNFHYSLVGNSPATKLSLGKRFCASWLFLILKSRLPILILKHMVSLAIPCSQFEMYFKKKWQNFPWKLFWCFSWI